MRTFASRRIFDTIDSGYALTDLVRDQDGWVIDLIGVEFSRNYTRYSGLPPFVGQRATDVITVAPKWLRQYEEVTRTGLPSRHENYIQDGDRWVSTYFSLVGELSSDRVALVFDDITERKRAEIRLRESEERQAFLLKLSDVLRAEPDHAIIGRAVEMLVEELQLDLCYVVTVFPDEDRADVVHQLRRNGMPGVPATIRLSDFPRALVQWQARTLVSDDMASDPGLTEMDQRNVAAMRFGALIAAPVRRGVGNPIWSIVAVMARSRRWTASQIALVEETAERTWAAVERARGEAALRESEERFQQFANASAAGLWIRKGKTLEIEFASPALAEIYGVEPDALQGDVTRWAALIVPEERDAALEHLTAVRAGETAVHEFRILRQSDGAFRWIRDTSFPLENGGGEIERIGGFAEDVTEANYSAMFAWAA